MKGSGSGVGDRNETKHRPAAGERRTGSPRHPQPAPRPRAARAALRTASFGCAAPSGPRMRTAPAVKTHCAIAAGKPLPGEGAAATGSRAGGAAEPNPGRGAPGRRRCASRAAVAATSRDAQRRRPGAGWLRSGNKGSAPPWQAVRVYDTDARHRLLRRWERRGADTWWY